MDIRAVEKAKKRLRSAELAFEKINAATSYSMLESAWTDFLLALHGIFNIIEQGAKSAPQSRQWFANVKSERKRDQLLNYLHQARNSDEHGVEAVTQLLPGSVGIGIGQIAVELHNVAIGPSGVSFSIPEGHDPVNVAITQWQARLKSVTDSRFGNVTLPPLEHKGTPIPPPDAKSASEMGLQYYKEVIGVAETLVSP